MIKIILLFLKSFTDYQGAITLFAGLLGLSAIYSYFNQKADYKRNAAKLILQEIRYAEQKIRKYREVTPNQYQLYDKLLPTNSWNDNIHLFIKELKETPNIDLISDFYAKATYVDKLIDIISVQINKTTSIPVSIPQNILNQKGEDYKPYIPPIPTKVLIGLPQMSQVSQDLLYDVSMKLEFIYNTTVVEKLRKISEKKWYQFPYLV